MHSAAKSAGELSRVYDLAAEYHAAAANGLAAGLAEVCREHPHLLPLVRAVLQAGERVAAAGMAAPAPEPIVADTPSDLGRYQLDAEVGRGGMGVVFAGRDMALDREVAVKLLRPDHPAGPEVVRRFLEEAKITARLQHPGIPAVHEVGTLPDGRPFLAMKLIKGKTLAALVKGQGHGGGKWVGVFEAVCQAVGAAHAAGVIHRDLKPANVMVGAFGEVQVMDWGLAKKVRQVNAGRAESRERPGSSDTHLLTEHGSPPSDDTRPVADESSAHEAEVTREIAAGTRTGTVLGTPWYMAPEQAAGDPATCRTDVYGLGGILCFLLTGEPPVTATTAVAALQQAKAGDTAGAFTRLAASGGDPALVALCEQCLARDPTDRPADAGQVAEAVSRLRAAAEERVRKAERVRAAAEVEVREQRKRRRVQLALLAAVALLVVGVGAFVWWQDRQEANARRERDRVDAERQIEEARLKGETDKERELKQEQAEAGVGNGLELAARLRAQAKFKEAEAALVAALDLARKGAPDRVGAVERARRDLAFAVTLDDIRFRKWIATSAPGSKTLRFDPAQAVPKYRHAFATSALDLTALEPATAAERVAGMDIRAEVVAAVDDWALYEPDAKLKGRLLEVARRADPDPWRGRLRDPAVTADPAKVSELAKTADLASQPSAAVAVLVELMKRAKLDPVPVLVAARAKHPTSFELALLLGLRLDDTAKADAELIGPLEAARAIRPDSVVVWGRLGIALLNRGDTDGALAAHQKVTELDPQFALGYIGVGNTYYVKGDLPNAIKAYRQALALDSELALAHSNLGMMLSNSGDKEGAEAEYRLALALDPDEPLAHNNLGRLLIDRDDYGEAVRHMERAVALTPDEAGILTNFGIALTLNGERKRARGVYRKAIALDPKNALPVRMLGSLEQLEGNPDEAVKHYTAATTLDPKEPKTFRDLGEVWRRKREWDESAAAYRKAIDLEPKHAETHYELGKTLSMQHDFPAAEAAFRAAVKLDPKMVEAHAGLGAVCFDQEKYDDTIAAARAGVKVDPKHAKCHAILAFGLAKTGKTAEAEKEMAEATRLDPQWKGALNKLVPPTRPK